MIPLLGICPVSRLIEVLKVEHARMFMVALFVHEKVGDNPNGCCSGNG